MTKLETIFYLFQATSHNDPRFECMAVYANEAFYWLDVACWAPHAVTCEIQMEQSRGANGGNRGNSGNSGGNGGGGGRGRKSRKRG